MERFRFNRKGTVTQPHRKKKVLGRGGNNEVHALERPIIIKVREKMVTSGNNGGGGGGGKRSGGNYRRGKKKGGGGRLTAGPVIKNSNREKKSDQDGLKLWTLH